MINATLLFLSGPDLIIVAVVILFLFGGRKIPQLARGIGESMRQFKEGKDGNSNPKQDKK